MRKGQNTVKVFIVQIKDISLNINQIHTDISGEMLPTISSSRLIPVLS